MDLYYHHRDKIGHLRGTSGPVGGVASGVQAVRGSRFETGMYLDGPSSSEVFERHT